MDRQIEQSNNDLERVVEAYNAAEEDRKKTESNIAGITERINALQGQLDTLYGSVRALANTAYRGRSGSMNTLSVLLSGNAGDLVDQMATLKYVNRSQQREIDRYVGVKSQLDSERQQAQKLADEQAKQQRQLGERRTAIEAKIREQNELRTRLRVQPRPAPAEDTTPSTTDLPPASGGAGSAVAFAQAQLGKPYAWGAEGPNSYDCSGLTMKAWAAAGVSLPHNAERQWKAVPHVPRANLQPGDLVFYSGLGHVALYVGSNKIIHAPSAGDVVRFASVDMMTPYGYGRPS